MSISTDSGYVKFARYNLKHSHNNRSYIVI
jgi:hypothetical protein